MGFFDKNQFHRKTMHMRFDGRADFNDVVRHEERQLKRATFVMLGILALVALLLSIWLFLTKDYIYAIIVLFIPLGILAYFIFRKMGGERGVSIFLYIIVGICVLFGLFAIRYQMYTEAVISFLVAVVILVYLLVKKAKKKKLRPTYNKPDFKHRNHQNHHRYHHRRHRRHHHRHH